MQQFRYKARDSLGREASGVFLAPDRDDALNLLQESGFYVITLALDADRRFVRRWKRRIILPLNDRILMLECWMVLLQSGIPMQSSLERMALLLRQPSAAQALLHLQRLIEDGLKFSDALAASRLFPISWASLFVSGELQGDYIGPMKMLRDRCGMLRNLRHDMISVLIYPAILLGMVLVWIWIFAVRVVPAMNESLFLSVGQMPFWMRAILVVAEGIHHFFFWGVLAALAVVLAAKRRSQPDQLISAGQKWIPYWLPGIGKIMRSSHQLIILSELQMQLEAGIPMIKAVESLTWSVSHKSIRKQLFAVYQYLQQDCPPSQAFIPMGLFSPQIHTMIAVGDVSGKLPELLDLLVRETRLNLQTEVERFAIGLRSTATILTALMVGLLIFCFMTLFLSSVHGAAQAVVRNSSAISQAGI